MLKQFTTSVFIINNFERNLKIALIHHKKFERWMVPDGHIEHFENQVEAAIRETREETGGWIVCYGDKILTNLPITDMQFSISTKKFYTIGSTDKDLHGTIPNINIEAEKSLEYTLKKITDE